MMDNTAALDIRSVEKSYEEAGQTHRILEGVDLRLDRGAFAALLGRSGAGKSTLLNIIAGIDTPDQGEVWIDGTRVSDLDEDRRTAFRRERIGFVFQAFNLIPTLSALENVQLPLALIGVARSEAKDRAADYLAQVGLGDRGDSFPDRLSGGEQQRVAIARALVHRPALLLADEPTGNLDYATGREVMDLLHRLVRDSGVTMLVVTHDRSFLRSSDVVLQLQTGRLRAATDEEIAAS